MWLPFNTTRPSPEEREDLQLFRQWEVDFDRQAPPTARNGYGMFAARWNNEVVRRFKLHVEGDETVTLIHRKNLELLQDHYDNVLSTQRLTHLLTPTQQELYDNTIEVAAQ